ncbi:MAG: RsmE family RNA methyltransferase [Acidimicrobiales bacterium]
MFVDDIDAPALHPADRHHLERVLRLRSGANITVSDGLGRFRPARLGNSSLEPAGDVVEVPEPEPRLTVAFALVKGERPELVVQKLTEVGVDRIVPFVAERTVVRWNPVKGARNVERLGAVAREAAAQCRRAWLPEVASVATFADAAAWPGAALAHPDGDTPTLDHPTLLIGPEGGWSPEEEDAVPARVRLGPHVLRAETAAIVAGAFLAGLRAGVLAP